MTKNDLLKYVALQSITITIIYSIQFICIFGNIMFSNHFNWKDS